MKSSCLISNTGPLLALSGAGHLDLLPSLYARVLIPDAVDYELLRRARKIARTVYGLNVLGTVRILLESKKAGLIEKVEDVLIAMRDNGYWIHEDIVDYALKTAGER